MARTDLERERERQAAEAEEQMNARLRSMQQRLYAALSEVVAGLAIDEGGRLLFTMRNITAADKVEVVMSTFQRRENVPFLRWLFQRLLRLFGLNSRYMQEAGYQPQSVEDNVRALMMRRYGYDVKTDRIIRGGYLSTLASSDNLTLQVLRRINDALAARQSLAEFRRVFRADFFNPQGLGMVERHYRTFTNDLFAEFDRGVQAEYSEQLGLGFAIYAPNSVMSRTREFCERRVGNIYDEEEIQKWNGQEWKGKIPGKPVQLQCGGYNCRHHLHYLSEEDARRIAQRRGREINNYNPI